MELFALYTLKYLTIIQNLDLDTDKNFYSKAIHSGVKFYLLSLIVAIVIMTKL